MINVTCKLLLLLSLCIITGCSSNKKQPTLSDIVGTYMGQYGGGVEVFNLKSDGTFVQEFKIKNNTIYTSNGKWRFENEITQDGRWQINTNSQGGFSAEKIPNKKEILKVTHVRFEPFMIPKSIAANKKNNEVEVGTGIWSRDPERLEFGEYPYYATKMSNQTDDRTPRTNQ